jgi:hypothetical protein
MRRVRAAIGKLVGCFLVIVLIACGEHGTGPGLQHGIVVVAAPGSDTVDAKPLRALTVRAFDESGVPAAGRVIRFESIIGTLSQAFVNVAQLTAATFSTLAAPVADSSGGASVLLRMGTRAGDARLSVSIPETGLADTISFTVRPGNPIHVRYSFSDTSLMLGQSLPFVAKPADRYNNLYPIDATVTVQTPNVCSVTGPVVNALAMGRCILTSSYLTSATDSVIVGVVPDARMVALASGKLWMASVAGDGPRALTTIADFSIAPAWSPDGAKLVIYEGDPFSNSRITVLDTIGNRLVKVGAGTFMNLAYYARFSPDGQWVYFSGRASSEAQTIWRMHPDGTSRESMFTASGAYANPQKVSVSPDGNTLVFEAGGKISLLDVTTRGLSQNGILGTAPSFSPDGQQIAYVGPSGVGLFVANKDGTNVRSLSTATMFEWQAPQWTADGKWLLVQRSLQPLLAFIAVADGTSIPLKYATSYQQATIQPPTGR